MKKYCVGGAVRDRLLGLPVKDRHWCVVGRTPEQLVAAGFRQVGKDFPIFINLKTGEEYALARMDWAPGEGRCGHGVTWHPAATIEDDLRHRDFTINAMALDECGRLIDPVGGQRDIAARILRHVGPTFGEDPLRVLRGARFAAQLPEFAIAPETAALMSLIAAAGALDGLTPARVWRELEKALAAAAPRRFFEVLRQTGALARVFPEIDALFVIPQSPVHHPEGDVGTHTLLVLDQAARLSPDLGVRFAALAHDFGKALTPAEMLPRHIGHEIRGAAPIKHIVKRFSAPKRFADLALLACRWHLTIHRAHELRPGTMVDLLEAVDAFNRPGRLVHLLLVCEADWRGRKGFEDRPYPQADRIRSALAAAAPVTARELIAAGHGSGPALTATLHQKRAEAVRATLFPVEKQ